MIIIRILCDYNFHTVIHHCHPYIIVLVKGIKNGHIIDVAIPNNANIANNMIEKITNYLKVEMAR